MENKNTPVKAFEEILQAVLFPDPTSEGAYQSYFHREFWTVEDFGILMAAMTPIRYREIGNNAGKPATKTELNKCQKARKFIRRIIKDRKKEKGLPFLLIDNQISMTCWQYIRWAAANEVDIKFQFFRALPLQLMELYIEFQPIDVALRTKSRFSREYHRALYLARAREIYAQSPARPTRKQVYNDPRMQRVMHGFVDHDGKKKYYRKRTIMDSWLGKIDKCARGRPANS